MANTCWNCNEAVRGVICVGCGVLQAPPAELDPYAILGLDRRWHVDLAEADEHYRALARKVHPDRYLKKGPAERRFALQWTAAANEARRVLKDPNRRAWWLATGSPVPREQGGVKLDSAFLQEMFEWREEEEDRPGSMAERARAREAELDAELESIFSAWETGRGDLGLVEDRLSRLKYVTALTREQDHGEHRH
jgi:molecular chaperone HscB